MIVIHEVTRDAFLLGLILMPIVALGARFYRSIKWLMWVAAFETILLCVVLTTLVILVDRGRFPQATGMEGIALFVLPAIYIASVVISFALYGLVSSIGSRR